MYLVTIKSAWKRRVFTDILSFYEEGKQWRKLDTQPIHLVVEGDRKLTLLLLRMKKRYRDNIVIYRVGEGLSPLDIEKDYDDIMVGISINA